MTPTTEQIHALIAELRAEAVQEHAIALEIDPYTVNERGEKCPYPTTPLDQRLPSRAAAALSSLLERGPAIPEGWVLVPRAITPEMQRAYFNVIDDNMDRVMSDATFGRHSSNAEAYRAMIAAAPQPPALAVAEPEWVGKVEKRRDDLKAWLSAEAPYCAVDQRHLDANSPERAYWHFGYLMATIDILALLPRDGGATSSDIEGGA